MRSEMKSSHLSNVWQQHVIPAHINHVLVSHSDAEGMELAKLALRIAAPSAAEVTLCPSSAQAEADPHAAMAFLRKQGLTTFVEPVTAPSALQTILRVDESRSVDLIIMREHASSTTPSATQVARRVQRPVIACGPSFTQNQVTGTLPGPVLAATSMRESSRQVAHAAARLGMLVKAPLVIVHAVDIEHQLSRPDSLTGIDYQCHMLANWISSQGTAATAKIAWGPVAEEITRLAARANACLIVMGLDLAEEGSEAARSDGLRRNILLDAPCPVLLVPTFHAAGNIEASRDTRDGEWAHATLAG